MFQHLNVEHVFTRLIMYRLRETGHMDPVLNRQWILATSNNLFVYGMELMRQQLFDIKPSTEVKFLKTQHLSK